MWLTVSQIVKAVHIFSLFDFSILSVPRLSKNEIPHCCIYPLLSPRLYISHPLSSLLFPHIIPFAVLNHLVYLHTVVLSFAVTPPIVQDTVLCSSTLG